MTDIVVGLKSNALPVYLSKSKIEECKQHATKDVFPLPSKDGVDWFSIKVENSADIVTLFNLSRTSRTIVKCHSTDCKINESNYWNVNTLDKAKNLCPHLTKFRKFYLSQVLLNDQGRDDATRTV